MKRNTESLTVATVLSSISYGTVTGESLPAHPAGAPILTWVGLTEGEFGTAACNRDKFNISEII